MNLIVSKLLFIILTSAILMGCSNEVNEQTTAVSFDLQKESQSNTSHISETDAELQELNGVQDKTLTAELELLLEETNQKHLLVQKPNIEYEPYIYNGNPSLERKYINTTNADGTLTLEQVENDLDYLIYELQTHYGMYTYFGGDEAFYSVKEAVLEELAAASPITSQTLEDSLRTHMEFVKDCHFKINGNFLSKTACPIMYRECAFIKTETGFETKETHKQVESIAGYESVEEVFQQSISEEGEIVYYPVTFQDMYSGEMMHGEKLSGEELRVNYTDGSSQILSAPPYEYFGYKDVWDTKVSFHRNQGIPVLVSGFEMGYDESNLDSGGKEFLSNLDFVKDDPVVIVDLRYTCGGNEALSYKWFEKFTGQKVGTNYYCILRQGVDQAVYTPNTYTFNSLETLTGILGRKNIDGRIDYSISHTTPDLFADNDKLLIILTSKAVASGGETFIDMAHNVRNVLVIGENTGGGLRGRMGVATRLPDSKVVAEYGTFVNIIPEEDSYFREFFGFVPDIWVPAGEAEQLAIQFIKTHYK